MQNVSFVEICMKCQSLFSVKTNKEKYFKKMSSADFLFCQSTKR